jgi:O-antigen/teichoic acid export membrane protein
MSVGRDTGFNLAAALAPVFFTLVVTPVYLHVIGAERFGILAVCWTIVGALGFASLGMGPALTYRLALMDEESAVARSNHVWMALLISLAASFLGAFLVLIIGRAYFERFGSLPVSLKAEIRSALPFLAALLPLGTLSGVLNGALQGRKRFGALSAVSILNAAGAAITPLLAALLISPSVSTLILAMASADVLLLIVQMAVCIRIVPLRLPSTLDGEHVRALIGYGAWMSATALLAPFLLLFDRVVIGALRGPSAVAVYALAFNVLQGLLLLPASLSSAMLPRLAPLTREEDVRQLQSSWLIWLNGVLTPVVVTGIALSGPFFRLWVGSTLGSVASPVAAILLVGCWLHGIGHIPATVLIGRSRPDRVTKLLLGCLAPYVVVLYFATRYFGVIGAAIAWTLRAAFDLVLFLYARPQPADLWRMSISAALVFCAMAAALVYAWTSGLYWGLMALIIAAAVYQNRAILISATDEFRKLSLSTIDALLKRDVRVEVVCRRGGDVS